MSDSPVEVTADQAGFAMVPYWMLDASGPALRLYVLLLKYADNTTRVAWPSKSTLAKDLGMSVRNVDRLAIELEEMGAVTVTRTKTGGLNEANRYHVHLAQRKGRKVPQKTAVPQETAVPQDVSGSTAKNVGVVPQEIAGNLEPENYNQELEPTAPALFEAPHAVELPASKAVEKTAETPSHLIAKTLYEETKGALPFMGMKSMADWARRNWPDKDWREIGATMRQLHQAQRAVTKANMQRALDGIAVPGAPPARSTTDVRVHQGMALAAQYRAMEEGTTA